MIEQLLKDLLSAVNRGLCPPELLAEIIVKDLLPNSHYGTSEVLDLIQMANTARADPLGRYGGTSGRNNSASADLLLGTTTSGDHSMTPGQKTGVSLQKATEGLGRTLAMCMLNTQNLEDGPLTMAEEAF